MIDAEQTQEGKTIRNDRMIAAAVGSRLYAKVSDLDALPPTLVDKIEQFFHQLQQNAQPSIQADREARRGRGDEVGEAQHCKTRKEKR